MTIICALCGKRERHEARGLGKSCYVKARTLGMLGAFSRGRRAPGAKDRRDYWKARYGEGCMGLGKHQRKIIAILRDGGELYNDDGMWSSALWDEGRHWSGRVNAASCVALLARGLIYEVRREPGMGYAGCERVVYGLSERGRMA